MFLQYDMAIIAIFYILFYILWRKLFPEIFIYYYLGKATW